MFCEIPSVLYQNRYCTQENFDVVSRNSYADDKNNDVKKKYPSCLCVEKCFYSKKYSDYISTASIGSFVCTVSSCKDIEENFMLGEQYFRKQWKNHICVLDDRENYVFVLL